MSLTPHGRLQLVPPPPHLLSFPTRRSSDLSHAALIIFFPRFWRLLAVQAAAGLLGFIVFYLIFTVVPEWLGQTRSGEHTSELQSRPHLVCRLLLEKKHTDANPFIIRRPLAC